MRLEKGTRVIRIGEASAVVGTVTGARYKGLYLVRWHRKCARWMRRRELRLANPQEIAACKSLALPTLQEYASAL